MYVDEASCKGTGVARIIIKEPNRVTLEYALRLAFKATNIIVEYEALTKVLDLIKRMKPKRLGVYSDS